jgi:hypothetical protein
MGVSPVLLNERWLLSVGVSHVLKIEKVGVVVLVHLLVGVVLKYKWPERLLFVHLPFLKPVLAKFSIL